MNYKKAFYSKLEDCYLGVKIKDFHQNNTAKSGFSNLLKIKEQYFEYIKAYLDREIEESHDIYNKLFTFFDSYLNESGTPFFTDTPIYKNIYAKVYSNTKDTSLFYKTQNLYYVKSDTLYQSLTLSDDNETFQVYFDAKQYRQNADNSKTKLLFKLHSIDTKENELPIIIIKVLSQKDLFPELNNVFKQNSNEFSEEFSKAIKDSKLKINEEDLKKIFRSYKKQSEIDFFIHKNAKAFLQEQFDLWMFSYLYKDSEIQEWNPDKIANLQRIKNIAYEIISLIADFENELKAIWLKPKFAKKVEYVFSVDMILQNANNTPALLDSILNDKGFESQIKEWQELHLIDESFGGRDFILSLRGKTKAIHNAASHRDSNNIEFYNDDKCNKYRYLPIDTKHFSQEIKYKILSSFDNLESLLNGELIKSDNFQALNTLMPKYGGKVDLIYIDPPYNTPASEIIYKNNFKDSTWLSMMENRLSLGKEFLNQRGILSCAIDENEQENLGLLLGDIFYDYEKTCVSVVYNHGGIQGDNFSYSHEYAYFFYPVIKNLLNMEKRGDANIVALRDWGNGGSERNTAKNCFYPIYVKDSQIIGFGEVCKDDFHPTANIVRDDGVIEVYPIDDEGVERKWRNARDTTESIQDKLICKYIKGIVSIHRIKDEFRFKTCWYNKKYNANSYGSNILTNTLPNNQFDYPKSIYTVKDSIYLASKDDSVILDFFGGSGTTAHAVLELNREGANRKFVLVEQGEHFYNVMIPRIKKIAFSGEWKNGKLKDDEQVKPLNIAFRYYELESYEEALNANAVENKSGYKGKDYAKCGAILDYRKSRKLIDRLSKGESVYLDMHTESHKDFDIFHTLANLMGWKIKRLFLDSRDIESCEFDNGEIVSRDCLDLYNYSKLKNLIWWE